MSASASARGWAEAIALKLWFLLEVLLAFHERREKLRKWFLEEVLKPHENLGELLKKMRDFDGFADTADTEREAVAALLSISLSLFFFFFFFLCF